MKIPASVATGKASLTHWVRGKDCLNTLCPDNGGCSGEGYWLDYLLAFTLQL